MRQLSGVKSLYDRNLYACIQTRYRQNVGIIWPVYYVNKLVFHNIYLKYIEIPITTKCTLNCKECANLIQFYQNPYHLKETDIINDIRILAEISKEILQLRLLGGEPLLHPNLGNIVKQILQFKNIKNIQIVTNGTLLFNDQLIQIMSNNDRISVDISNYKEKSVKYKELIQQLQVNNIKYYTSKDGMVWSSQAACFYRKRNKKKMEEVFTGCTMDCVSLLNGQVHLCPRSSHGMDLKIVPENRVDYCDLRQNKTKMQYRKELYKLLNTKYILACNYCDIYKWKELPEVEPAEQISKNDAKLLLEKYKGER